MATYKTFDLFGNETINFIENNKKSKSLFDDYEGFVHKFEVKKTTDDCYTPTAVYAAVLKYISLKFDLSNHTIIRPFYPDGDFESIDYLDNSVVIDNPPFSILAKIARFYVANNVKFFLFAPHLTLFSCDIDLTAVVVGSDIVYDNGAVIKTSFLSNIFGDLRVLAAPELYSAFRKLITKVDLPKYIYPSHVLTVSKVQKLVENGISFEIKKDQLKFCTGLHSQKKYKKAIFGCGFLLSEKAAAEKAAAEKAAENAAAEKAAENAAENGKIIWELSKKELEIIKSLT